MADGYALDLQGGGDPARTRVQRGGLRNSGGAPVGRLADAPRARQAAAAGAWTAAARRTDQPSRSRSAQLARGIPGALPRGRDPGLARSLLPRRGGGPHRRPVAAHDHRLSLQLLALPRPARRAPGAPARGQEAAGRGSRPRAGVHRPLPLPGDEGGPGAEPHQDAREGRADRGAAGTKAHPLPVSGRRQERPHRARPDARVQGLRRQAGARRHHAAHRARRSRGARRSQRRRQVDAHADARRRRGARRRQRARRGIRS